MAELPAGRAGDYQPAGLLNASNSHLLALAPHTASLVQHHLAAMGVQRSVDLFVPVFPVDLSCSPREKQVLVCWHDDCLACLLQAVHQRSLVSLNAFGHARCVQDSRDNCASIERPERKGFVLQGLFQAQR